MDQIHKVHKRGLVSVENILFVGFAEDISAIVIKFPRPWVEWVELLHLWLATLFFSETIIMYKYKSSQYMIDKLIQYIGRSGRCWGRSPDMQLTGSDVSGHYSINYFLVSPQLSMLIQRKLIKVPNDPIVHNTKEWGGSSKLRTMSKVSWYFFYFPTGHQIRFSPPLPLNFHWNFRM